MSECVEVDSVDDFVLDRGDKFVQVSDFFSDQRGIRLPACQHLPGAGCMCISWCVTEAGQLGVADSMPADSVVASVGHIFVAAPPCRRGMFCREA